MKSSTKEGKPGAPPSPNEQKVLDVVLRMHRETGHSWFTWDEVHACCRSWEVGGSEWGTTYETVRWHPWHRSTVRDHLNRLANKGHVDKIYSEYGRRVVLVCVI